VTGWLHGSIGAMGPEYMRFGGEPFGGVLQRQAAAHSGTCLQKGSSHFSMDQAFGKCLFASTSRDAEGPPPVECPTLIALVAGRTE
ncbi:hypothetical protein N9L68_05885, partial [bacterium]|nr:hypothetical protein [bacterium]